MTTLHLTEALAADHNLELRRQACTARLIALATGCRPSAWARAARHAAAGALRLGDSVRRDRSPHTPCCAPAA